MEEQYIFEFGFNQKLIQLIKDLRFKQYKDQFPITYEIIDNSLNTEEFTQRKAIVTRSSNI